MLKDITIGQYFPGDSLVHEYDPKLKILTMFVYIISLFFIDSFIMYIPIVIYLFLILFNAKLPVGLVLRGLKPLRLIIFVTFLINLFFTPGKPIYELGFLKISQEGIDLAFFMGIRLILLVLGTSLLTYTTSPIELTDGIESLLRPFRKIGVPSHEIAMMMTIALRFIPTLIEETDKIMKAQMARGADFESGNLISRAKNLVPLLVPLFINSFRRAEELATAMESRCYRGGDGRTKMNTSKITSKDISIFVGNIIFFVAVIVGSKI
ncbi:energy-coupling factor transporter transmembrane protein EcfT [Peptoniphilus sp. MSJ-1]|uniref:Energy-coupling factor transporter transmembrane protein EcfT n=1 Tax=Peptoniphilus ovalis TaxID=2841503 RepID=A0ABS6FGW6_9FIRM|nr:energy-coupling factor transporter transmembrane component T [Peptoniphilus ovalis]MBU5669414.1 energy-coupling factor transporter transmembrane protein EcfT [Peptoniphilus ovalis]